jgi:uncharacterized protein DUF4255
VIQDVDATLKELLVQRVPVDVNAIDIKFDMPNKDWSATISKPTLNLFLYDIRENHELRGNQRALTRTDDAGTDTPAPVRLDLCYLITAWTTDISDEHQLLGRVLTTLLKFPVLPHEVLKGAMQTQPFPLRAWIVQPERMPNPWEFWGHMDHGMKASLHFVLTTSLEPGAAIDVRYATQPILNIGIKPKPHPLSS